MCSVHLSTLYSLVVWQTVSVRPCYQEQLHDTNFSNFAFLVAVALCNKCVSQSKQA